MPVFTPLVGPTCHRGSGLSGSLLIPSNRGATPLPPRRRLFSSLHSALSSFPPSPSLVLCAELRPPPPVRRQSLLRPRCLLSSRHGGRCAGGQARATNGGAALLRPSSHRRARRLVPPLPLLRRPSPTSRSEISSGSLGSVARTAVALSWWRDDVTPASGGASPLAEEKRLHDEVRQGRLRGRPAMLGQ
jgi:hypothetical protein